MLELRSSSCNGLIIWGLIQRWDVRTINLAKHDLAASGKENVQIKWYLVILNTIPNFVIWRLIFCIFACQRLLAKNTFFEIFDRFDQYNRIYSLHQLWLEWNVGLTNLSIYIVHSEIVFRMNGEGKKPPSTIWEVVRTFSELSVSLFALLRPSEWP